MVFNHFSRAWNIPTKNDRGSLYMKENYPCHHIVHQFSSSTFEKRHLENDTAQNIETLKMSFQNFLPHPLDL